MPQEPPPPAVLRRSTTKTVLERYRREFGTPKDDLDTSYAGAMWHVIALSHLIMAEFEEMLKGSGLSAADMFVMGVMLIEDEKRMRPSDIARVLYLTPAAISIRIGKLENAGLVERHYDSQDRRNVRLRLTSAGADLIRTYLSKVAKESSFAHAFSKMAPDGRSVLEDMLLTLTQEMERHTIKI